MQWSPSYIKKVDSSKVSKHFGEKEGFSNQLAYMRSQIINNKKNKKKLKIHLQKSS